MKFIAAILVILFYISLFIAAVAGYIMNITSLLHHVGFGILEVLRIIGIFMPPLGAIMGYL